MRMSIIVEYGDPKPRRFRSHNVLKKRRSKEFDGRGLSKLWNSIYESMTNAINTASMTIEVQWYVSYDYFSVMWGEMSVILWERGRTGSMTEDQGMWHRVPSWSYQGYKPDPGVVEYCSDAQSFFDNGHDIKSTFMSMTSPAGILRVIIVR